MSIRNIPIAVRAHTENNKEKRNWERPKAKVPFGKRILVLDTETTTDVYQNLLFGHAFLIEREDLAHEGGRIIENEHFLFYGDNILPDKMEIINTWAEEKEIKILSRQDFVKKIFIPEIQNNGSVCVGFNLNFDLPRLAMGVRTRDRGRYKDAFELLLSDDRFTPSILLEPLDSKKSFISFKSYKLPEGRFLDLRTLIFALTNESHSLDTACKLFGTKQKTELDEGKHGVISIEYLKYNYDDVTCTLLLYEKLMEEYYKHPIAETLEAGKAYSPASIGKAYYKLMGVKPLREVQPDFPKEVLGFAMASYYGGRAECHYRGIPIDCFHVDVLSMYPSVFTLQGLWQWVIASGFDVTENTDEIKGFLKNITLDDLFRQDIWTSVPGLVLVRPDKDLLPVRGEYDGDTYQIGLNYLTSKKPLWFTLADVIACKILTGKFPKIIKALKITPKEPQASLNPVKLRGQVEVNPVNDNFFKRVIELRKKFQKQSLAEGDEMDSLQIFLKTLANSTAYGVYVELNREKSTKEVKLEIYGLDSYSHTGKDYEKPGAYYNPLIATMITAGARLILAMAQKSVQDLGGDYAYCDTDSMTIIDLLNDNPEAIGRQVIKRFESLVPYDFRGSLLQAEKVNWRRLDWNNVSVK